jgi:ribosomal protein S18 acetylase RimI-like enzyme
MRLRSLGYRTDLIFPAYDGEIIDRGRYLVVRTPSSPTYHWGNFLLFADPPAAGDFAIWRGLFAQEIGTPRAVHHETYGWDSPDGSTGEVKAFLDAGFELGRMDVLRADEICLPPKASLEVEIRHLRSDGDWQQALENQVRCRDPEYPEAGYRVFKQDQMARYRGMTHAGLGAWYGAFVGEALVADLGIFHNGDIARFQNVETHPAYRRRGIARAMVHQASEHAQAHFDVRTLVIVADHDSVPSRLYQSLGFKVAEQQVGLEWWQDSP